MHIHTRSTIFVISGIYIHKHTYKHTHIYIIINTSRSLPLPLMTDRRGCTFKRAGSNSIIDLPFENDGLVSRTARELTEDFTNNDHQAIVMTVTGRNPRGNGLPNFTEPKLERLPL